jgi:hypothetical protein
MVSVGKANAYDLRQHLVGRVAADLASDPFKASWLAYLGMAEPPILAVATLPLYQRCEVAGLGIIPDAANAQDLTRLLGQAAKIDSTPRPWVSDVVGVAAIKWFVDQQADSAIDRQFKTWCDGFLGNQITSSKFDDFEHDLASYIRDPEKARFVTAAVPLFLHYTGKLGIGDQKVRFELIDRFMGEFRQQSNTPASPAVVALMVYVFDKINQDVGLVPPSGWSLHDLVTYLENIPVGLRKWTWEEAPRTKGATPVKWFVDNEYHVQNLLYALLAPMFKDISDEVYLSPVGQKTPRIDLDLPSLQTIIEVKYRKDTKTSFQKLIGEIAEDVTLYRSDPKYKNVKIVTVVWDQTRSTQDHSKFRQGVLKLGVDGCVVISAPSSMERSLRKDGTPE